MKFQVWWILGASLVSVFATVLQAQEQTPSAWEKSKSYSSEAWTATKETSASAWAATKETSAEIWSATKKMGKEVWENVKSMPESEDEAADEEPVQKAPVIEL